MGAHWLAGSSLTLALTKVTSVVDVDATERHDLPGQERHRTRHSWRGALSEQEAISPRVGLWTRNIPADSMYLAIIHRYAPSAPSAAASGSPIMSDVLWVVAFCIFPPRRRRSTVPRCFPAGDAQGRERRVRGPGGLLGHNPGSSCIYGCRAVPEGLQSNGRS